MVAADAALEGLEPTAGTGPTEPVAEQLEVFPPALVATKVNLDS